MNLNVTFENVLDGFRAAGIAPADTVLLQSALRPFGYVEGGGDTVARALCEAVGAEGTVVAPAFCFAHEIEENPVIDPANDPSEMGAISEAVRRLPGARRSAAYRHSFSAVGKNAACVTQVDHALPVFDMRSSFGRMLALNAKVVLAGVTYVNSTSHHFGEYLLQVPDRHTVEQRVRLKRPDGLLEQTVMTDYQPKPTETGEYYAYPHDFNKLGLWLEQAGKVQISVIGNAVIRVFRMRDLIDMILYRYPLDPKIFCQDAAPVILPFGREATRDYVDGAGRPDTAVWACADPEKICRR